MNNDRFDSLMSQLGTEAATLKEQEAREARNRAIAAKIKKVLFRLLLLGGLAYAGWHYREPLTHQWKKLTGTIEAASPQKTGEEIKGTIGDLKGNAKHRDEVLEQALKSDRR